MADRRPKVIASLPNQDAKRRASVSSPTGSNKSLRPTHHPLPPVQSPHGSFPIPTLPDHTRVQPPPQKIAIPRLRRDSDILSPAGTTKNGDKHRVSHACEPCRHRKTKCSGESPVCKHCEDFRIECVYADGKRDRVKKEFGNMAGRLEDYEKLLRQLSLHVDISDQVLIQRALDKEVTPEEDVLRSSASPVKESRTVEHPAEPDDETQVSAEIGSIGSQDHIKEDFNRSSTSRATGFVGKNSEISWMHRLREQSGDTIQDGASSSGQDYTSQERQFSHTSVDEAVSDSSYHCDDFTVLIPDQVEPWELPPRHTAELLLQTYLEIVHPTFPIIGKVTFTAQVKTFFDNDQLKPGESWFAILNLIFAIATKYSHLVQADWRGDERDHLIYFTRARMLGMNEDTILGHPDLQRVQIAALMSFYLLSINQISRAWIFSGLAVRYGISLGLNLRNENDKVRDTHKEIRYRVWWALYGLERLLGAMTGRPTSIENRDCTVPLPIPIEEEAFNDPSSGMLHGETVRLMRRISSEESTYGSSSPSSSQSSRIKQSPNTMTPPLSQQSKFDLYKNVPASLSLYFLFHTRLSILTNRVLVSLYRAGAMQQSWAQIQSHISALDAKLEKWRVSLPSVFDFTKKQRDQQFGRQRLNLGFFYYGTRILINRPCLCRLDRRIEKASNRCKVFNWDTATLCVRAAKGMLDLLPAEPNPVGLYKIAPWWCLLHHLVQAATILMIELSFRADHMPYEVEEILGTAKKAVLWLNEMSGESVAAKRAWKMCDDMLRKVAPKVGREVNDLPKDIPPSRAHTSSGSSASRQSHLMWTSDGEDVWEGPQKFAQQFPGQTYYGGPQPDHDTVSHPPMYTLYDEYIAHSPSVLSTSVPTSSISAYFPSSIQMNSMAMEDGDRGVHNLFFGQNQQWQPSRSSQ